MLPRFHSRPEDRSDDTSVYLYYDSADTLIYVGITSRGIWRNREHDAIAEWWPFVARQEVEHHASRAVALLREKTLIMQFQPPFNKDHNRDHAAVKAAYLDWHDRGGVDTDPRELMKSMGRILPVTVVDIGLEDRFALKVHPDYYAVSSRLVDTADTVVRAGGLVGKITEQRTQGAFAFFLVKGKSKRPINLPAIKKVGFAPVKFANTKATAFRLHCVELSRFKAPQGDA